MSKNQYLKLDKGLAIYQKDGTPYWYAYIYLKDLKKPTHKSLETESIKDAMVLAMKKKIELETRLELGQTLDEKTFKEVLVEYQVEVFKSSHSAGDYEYTFQSKTKKINETVRRELRFISDHLLPRVGNVLINGVKTHHVLKLIFKEGEDETVFANSTIAARKALFVKIFEFAKSKEYLKEEQVPSLPDIKTRKRVIRESFNADQVEEINKIMLQMANFPIQKNASQITIENRWMLYYLFNFNLYLGSRTGREIVENVYKDIQKHNKNGKDFFTIHVYKGKTENYSFSRKMTISRKSEAFLRELTQYSLNCSLEEAIKNHPLRPIFVRPSDRKVPNYVEQWQKVREIAIEKGVLEKEKEHLYTLYSTRHFFMTNALLKGDSNSKLSLAELSKHVGASTDIIEHTYSHITSLESSDKHLDLFTLDKKQTELIEGKDSEDLLEVSKIDFVEAQSNIFDQLFGSGNYSTSEDILKRFVSNLDNISELKAGIAYVQALGRTDKTLQPYIDIVKENENKNDIRHYKAFKVLLSALIKFNKLFKPDEFEDLLSLIEPINDIYENNLNQNDDKIPDEDLYLCWFYHEEKEEQSQVLALAYYAAENLPDDMKISAKGEFFSRVVSILDVDNIEGLRNLINDEVLEPVISTALLFYHEAYDFIDKSRLTAKFVYPLLDHFSIDYEDIDAILMLGNSHEKYHDILFQYCLELKNIEQIITYFMFGEKILNRVLKINE